MPRTNKYVYLFVVQGDYGYGHGWEDLSASESRREARQTLREYRENDADAKRLRLIQRRELRQRDDDPVVTVHSPEPEPIELPPVAVLTNRYPARESD